MNYIDSKVDAPLTTNVLYQSAGTSTTAHRVVTKPYLWHKDIICVECTSHFASLDNEKVYMYLDEASLLRLISQLQEAYDETYETEKETD